MSMSMEANRKTYSCGSITTYCFGIHPSRLFCSARNQFSSSPISMTWNQTKRNALSHNMPYFFKSSWHQNSVEFALRKPRSKQYKYKDIRTFKTLSFANGSSSSFFVSNRYFARASIVLNFQKSSYKKFNFASDVTGSCKTVFEENQIRLLRFYSRRVGARSETVGASRMHCNDILSGFYNLNDVMSSTINIFFSSFKNYNAITFHSSSKQTWSEGF